MLKNIRIYLLLLFSVFLTNRAFATLITFDDLDASWGDVSLDALSPYEGFSWENFYTYTSFPGFDGFNNGIVSGVNGAYSGGETIGAVIDAVIGSITSTSLFNLESLYLGSGYYDDLLVTIQGWRDGVLVASQTFLVDTGGAIFTALDFLSIDTITFFSTADQSTTDPYSCGMFNCTQFTIDNLLVSEASAAPEMPVNAPSALFILAMSVLWMMYRKRSS